MKSGGRGATQFRKGRESGQETAEARAIEALAFLAGDQEKIGRFLDLSGLTLQTLRRGATNPGFLGAVLDYVAADPALLADFVARSGHTADDIEQARAVLAGPPSGFHE